MSNAGEWAGERDDAQPVARVHVRAPGKVNLFLGVDAPDEDGYHPLSTVFQAVSLYEDVVATPADDVTVSVSGVADPSTVPLDDRNLALRAAKLLAVATGFDGGVHLELHKTVPVAGGMGGGSADAAAALLACNELWRTGLSHERLHALAARLGADVPFALMGGTAVGSGRGDVLTPALSRGRYEWVLLVDDEGLSTPAVYRAFDEIAAEDRASSDEAELARARRIDPVQVPPEFFEALLSGDALRLGGHLRNQLEARARVDAGAPRRGRRRRDRLGLWTDPRAALRHRRVGGRPRRTSARGGSHGPARPRARARGARGLGGRLSRPRPARRRLPLRDDAARGIMVSPV